MPLRALFSTEELQCLCVCTHTHTLVHIYRLPEHIIACCKLTTMTPCKVSALDLQPLRDRLLLRAELQDFFQEEWIGFNLLCCLRLLDSPKIKFGHNSLTLRSA